MTKKLYLPLLMAMVVALFSSYSLLAAKKWVNCQLITSLLLRKCWRQ